MFYCYYFGNVVLLCSPGLKLQGCTTISAKVYLLLCFVRTTHCVVLANLGFAVLTRLASNSQRYIYLFSQLLRLKAWTDMASLDIISSSSVLFLSFLSSTFPTVPQVFTEHLMLLQSGHNVPRPLGNWTLRSPDSWGWAHCVLVFQGRGLGMRAKPGAVESTAVL